MIEWKDDPAPGCAGDDYADPAGDGSWTLSVFAVPSGWHWEMHHPEGYCAGTVSSREDARKMAEKLYRFLKEES